MPLSAFHRCSICGKLRKGQIVVVANYQPYCSAREISQEGPEPHPRERELDRPAQYFSSIVIR